MLWATAMSPGSADALPFFGHRGPPLERVHLRQADWRLDIVKNPFSGVVACRLSERRHRAIYMAGAVGLRFYPSWNTAAAVYRVDGGAPRTARDDVPRLVALGVPFDRGGIANGTNGMVWLPWDRIAHADTVDVAARPDKRALRFRFRGLAEMLAAGRERGCTPDSRFVER